MKVSVIIPVLDGERWLKKSLASLFNQTLQGFEIIVVDDGSSDKTELLLKKIKDPRLKIISFRRNKGIVHALNAGIAVANGDYIARHDIDDISKPLRLEKLARFLDENPDCGAVASRVEFIDADENKYSGDEIDELEELNNILSFDDIQNILPYQNPIVHGSVMLRKEALKKIGGYKLAYQFIEDYELWMRMINKFSIQKLKDKLYICRMHQDMMRNKKAKFLELMSIKLKLIYLRKNFFENKRYLKVYIQGIGHNSQAFTEIARINKFNILGYVAGRNNEPEFLGKPIISYKQLITKKDWDIFVFTNLKKSDEQAETLIKTMGEKVSKVGFFLIRH